MFWDQNITKNNINKISTTKNTMGVVISSVVAAGPAVLEDLETPYDVIVERRNKANEKKNQKHKLRRQPHQIHFEALQ